MSKDRFTDLGNSHHLIRVLGAVLDSAGVASIEKERRRVVAAMHHLALTHKDVADRLPQKHWRSKISRLYYSAYIMNRAVRYAVAGSYESSSTDHAKSQNLPGDFPGRDNWANFFRQFKLDRNMCDYDYDADQSELFLSLTEYKGRTQNFMETAALYLQQNGNL